MIITQIRKLALFEFIDTSSFTNWMKGLLGSDDEEKVPEDFCDPEKEVCDEEEEAALLRNLRRFLQEVE